MMPESSATTRLLIVSAQPEAVAEEPPARPDAYQPPLGDGLAHGRVRPQLPGPGPDGVRESSWYSWPTFVGFLFLTFNSCMAILRSPGDPWAVAFVVFSYVVLVALFACLRLYERTDHGSPRREHLKVAVWLLTTMLTAAFTYKVAAIMPLPVAMLVYAMAFATVAGGYYAFFIYDEK